VDKARILVVEDLPALGELIAAILRLHQHDCVGVATTGAQALRLARSWKPQLALVDVVLRDDVMSEQAGLRAARWLQRECGVPSLFVTAAPHRVQPRRDGCGVLAKPFRAKTLALAVAGALNMLRDGRAPEDLPAGLSLWLPAPRGHEP
jgi:DNA-binding response OmpR family regulator